MRMKHRRFAGVHVHVEERSIKSRQEQRRNGAACSHFSHRRILMKPSGEVNAWTLKSS